MTARRDVGAFYADQPRRPAFMDDPRRACNGVDTEVFYTDERATDEAKAICRRCPFRDRCATWALDSSQPFGVWGGLTAEERTAIKRSRPVAA